jgi:hypothetical protein
MILSTQYNLIIKDNNSIYYTANGCQLQGKSFLPIPVTMPAQQKPAPFP